MLCGYLPFEDPNTDKLYKKILDCHYSIPDYVSEQGRQMIQKILNPNPEERYTINQIRNHPWFVINLDKSKRADHDAPNKLEIFSLKSNNLSDTTAVCSSLVRSNNKEIKINP